MLAGSKAGIGEWGFSALVEADDGHRILVDTGARPDTVLENARDLGIDLSSVSDVILTHNHDDHVGGLLTLRRELMKKNPAALSVAYVAKGIFYSRPSPEGEDNAMIAIRKQYEATGGKFIELSDESRDLSRRLAHRSGAAQVSRAQLEREGQGADPGRPGGKHRP